MINCDKYTPKDIIEICILYCFILEEFNQKKSGKCITIKKIENVIATCKPMDGPILDIASLNNIITKHGQYHWRFKVLYFDYVPTKGMITESLYRFYCVFINKFK